MKRTIGLGRTSITVFLGLVAGAQSSFADEFRSSPDALVTELQLEYPSPQDASPEGGPPQPPPDQAANEAPKKPWRTFEFQFGPSYSVISSGVALNRKGGIATLSIQPEQALGMEDELLSPSAWLAFRIGDIHRVQFAFDDYTRNSTVSLIASLQFNNNTYTAGTNVHTTFGVQFFYLAYVLSVFQDERMDIGLSLGIDWIRTHFNVESSTLKLIDNERINVPYPLPGFDFDFALSRDWWIRQRLNPMYISVSGYTGLVFSFDMALEWAFIDHLAVGLGGNFKRLEFGKTNNSTAWGNFSGSLNFDASGVLLYLNVFF